MTRPLVIQMDTREKIWCKGHILDAFARQGIPYIRSKMFVGDYTLLHDQTVCIDVKQGLQEVYSNLVHEHERFLEECKRAGQYGIKLLLLVEEPGINSLDDVRGWENPRRAQYEQMPPEERPKKPPISSLALERIMRTMEERYGIVWLFCAPEQTGEQIINILTQKSGPVLQRGAWSVG